MASGTGASLIALKAPSGKDGLCDGASSRAGSWPGRGHPGRPTCGDQEEASVTKARHHALRVAAIGFSENGGALEGCAAVSGVRRIVASHESKNVRASASLSQLWRSSKT